MEESLEEINSEDEAIMKIKEYNKDSEDNDDNIKID